MRGLKLLKNKIKLLRNKIASQVYYYDKINALTFNCNFGIIYAWLINYNSIDVIKKINKLFVIQ